MIDLATGTSTEERGPVATVRFTDPASGDKVVEIWLPHNESTLLVGLRADVDLVNLVSVDLLRRRAFGPAIDGYLDTIRDGHPATPLLMVTPILRPIHESTRARSARRGHARTRRGRAVATGDPAEVTAAPIGKLTLQAIRAELTRIVGMPMRPPTS